MKLFARRFGKKIDVVPPESMSALERYPWPGNVRELQHLIERAVILSTGNELRVPLMELVPILAPDVSNLPHPRPTLRENERDLIQRTLEDCGWVIGGPEGAAARLGMKRTTLVSRIKKLGLHRPSQGGVE